MALVSPFPRTNIITLASPSAGPFLVGFRLFEADALRVHVDGILTTDWTLSASFLAGYDDDATITFGSTLDTGAEVQIDGFMTPARNTDYLNGPGLVDALNHELARIWATVSENRMFLKRAILGLSDVGPGDAADADGRRIKNIGAPEDNDDALRLIDVQNIIAAAGSVPAPTGGQTGYLMQATGAGTYGWIARAAILGAALEAIKALTPAANTVPYFTSTSAAALMTTTSSGRTALKRTASTGFAASATIAQGQAPIPDTDSLVVISAIASPGAVTLPVPISGENGREITIVHTDDSSADLSVYPSASTGFSGTATNDPMVIPPGHVLQVKQRFLTQWSHFIAPMDRKSVTNAKANIDHYSYPTVQAMAEFYDWEVVASADPASGAASMNFNLDNGYEYRIEGRELSKSDTSGQVILWSGGSTFTIPFGVAATSYFFRLQFVKRAALQKVFIVDVTYGTNPATNNWSGTVTSVRQVYGESILSPGTPDVGGPTSITLAFTNYDDGAVYAYRRKAS